jgi:hypothetical protein
MSTITRPRAWLERRRERAEADQWIGHDVASCLQTVLTKLEVR